MLNRALAAILTVENACRRRWQGAPASDTAAHELHAAVGLLRHAALKGVLSGAAGAGDIPADDLVEAWISAGGDWQALVGAVNRHSLDGATRRAS